MTDNWEEVYEKWGAKPPSKSNKKWLLFLAIVLIVSGFLVYGAGIFKQENVSIGTNESISKGVYCGDNICDLEESCSTCPNDCGECIILKCLDGTLYNQCSITKPLYCDNGTLVDRCSLCGCPQGDICDNGKCIDQYSVSYDILVIEVNINQNEAGYLPINIVTESMNRIESESLLNGFDIRYTIDVSSLNLGDLPSEFSADDWTESVDYICSSVLPAARSSGYDSKNYDIVTVYLGNKNNWAPGFKYEDSIYHLCSDLPMAYILSIIQTSAYPGYNHPLPYCDLLGGTTHEFGHIIYKAPDYCCSDNSRNSDNQGWNFECSGLPASTVIDAICITTNVPKNWCPSQCDYNIPNSDYCKQEQLLNVGSSTTPVFSSFVYDYAKENGIYRR